jgi:hypothetical protein
MEQGTMNNESQKNQMENKRQTKDEQKSNESRTIKK